MDFPLVVDCSNSGSSMNNPITNFALQHFSSFGLPNRWICHGSVFPTVGGVNPSLTIQAIACRTADRIGVLASRGELS